MMHSEDWCLCNDCIPETMNDLEKNKMKLFYLIANTKLNGAQIDGHE